MAMTGYHEVQTFIFPLADLEHGVGLPENWKPFSSVMISGVLVVVARRWHRGPKPE